MHCKAIIGINITKRKSPKASRLLLMEMPSFNLPPIAFVFLILSLPARSTRWNLDDVAVPDPNPMEFVGSRVCGVVMQRENVQIAWDLDEVAFIAVVPVALDLVATSNSLVRIGDIEDI